jgi:hypothetical protein
MYFIKKSVIFDIEQRYFLLNKINVKFGKPLFYWDFITLFYYNQQNLIAI